MSQAKYVKGSIDVWRRRKEIYERHQAGETYVAIARDLGITSRNAMSLAHRWKTKLEGYVCYRANPQIYIGFAMGEKAAMRYEELANAGLLGDKKRSPEYAYA